MSKAPFASLVTLPDIITEPGEYITRGGEVVTVNIVSNHHDFGCKGVYTSGMFAGTPEGWHKSGRLYLRAQSANDIIKRK